MQAQLPYNEDERLQELYTCGILDTEAESVFDDAVLLASQICDAPIAALTLIDEHRQWFKSILGLDAKETSREIAFCAHTILQREMLVVPDTTVDSRFADNPLVTGGIALRFYAGAPLVTASGHALGTLCVLDNTPRTLTRDQQLSLEALSRHVMSQIEIRRYARQQRIFIEERENALKALRQSEERYYSVLEGMQEGVIVQDKAGNVLVCNAGARRILGLHDSGKSLGADTHWRCLSEDFSELPPDRHPIMLTLADGKPRLGVCVGVYLPDDTLRWLHVETTPMFEDDEALPHAAVAIFTDITRKREVEHERARLAAVVEHSKDAILGANLAGTIVSWNPGCELLYGYSAAEMVGKSVGLIVPEEEHEAVREIAQAVALGERRDDIQVTRRRKDGVELHISFSYSPITNDKGEVIGITAIGRNVTERKLAQAQIEDFNVALQFQMDELKKANAKLANLSATDSLTGLANHRTFQERLASEFARARRYNKSLSLILFDVDYFKQYNDSFGHPAGDIVLQKVAEIMFQVSRESDMAARYGGEEFAIILPETDSNGALAIAERLRVVIDGASWDNGGITVSIGACSANAGMNDHADLIAAADLALYEAKRSGRNRVETLPVQA